MLPIAVLLAVLRSFVAPVVPVRLEEPTAVGVPATVQVMLAPGATVAGVTGEQVPTVTPVGRPVSEQLAAIAGKAGDAALEQAKVPL